MAWPLLIFLQISIGALIGGLTNKLAIMMLFRPHEPIYLGKRKLPFTPGLIPKRRRELASQIGKIIEEHLITPEGVRQMLRDGNAEREVAAWFQRKWDEWETSEATVETILEKVGVRWDERLEETLKSGVARFLETKLADCSGKTLDELLPEEIKRRVENELIEYGPVLLHKMSDFFTSEEGAAFVRQTLERLAGGLGMFGGFASMFLADEKIVRKVSESLRDAFQNERLKDKLATALQNEVRQLYDQRLGEIIERIGKEQAIAGIERLVDEALDFDRIRQAKPSEKWSAVFPIVRERIPGLVRALFARMESRLDKTLKKINLAGIATKEVENFSVQKLERVIVSVTSRELKMITWLGALLGGIIGAVQGLLVLWLG